MPNHAMYRSGGRCVFCEINVYSRCVGGVALHDAINNPGRCH